MLFKNLSQILGMTMEPQEILDTQTANRNLGINLGIQAAALQLSETLFKNASATAKIIFDDKIVSNFQTATLSPDLIVMILHSLYGHLSKDFTEQAKVLAKS